MQTFLLVNGPNLNLLGQRETEVYGTLTLDEIIADLKKTASAQGAKLLDVQSNHEGVLVDFIQAQGATADGAIINAGAFSHTSIALRDALLARPLPFVEVHLSNIYARETFRQHSWLSDIAAGTIIGLGALGYRYALDWLIQQTVEEPRL